MKIAATWLLLIGWILAADHAYAETEPMIEVAQESEFGASSWIVSFPNDPESRFEITPVWIEGDPGDPPAEPSPLPSPLPGDPSEPPAPPAPPEVIWSPALEPIWGASFNMPQIVGVMMEAIAGVERCESRVETENSGVSEGEGKPEINDCWLFGGLVHGTPGLGATKAGVGVIALAYEEQVDKDGKITRVLVDKHSLKAIAVTTYIPPTHPSVTYVGGEFETSLGLARGRGGNNMPKSRMSGYVGLVIRMVDGKPDLAHTPWETMLVTVGFHINY